MIRLIVILGLCIVVLIVFLIVRRRALPSTTRGMKQYAQDPARMAEVGRQFEERERLNARAHTLSDAELQAGVEALLSGDAYWMHIFEKVGPRVRPFLLRALTDPRCDSSAASEVLKGPTIFEAVTRSLASLGSAEVIPALEPWRTSDDERKRQHAYLCISMTGVPEAVAATRLGLHSQHESDRSYTCMGIEWAAKYEHVSPAFRDAISQELELLATGEPPFLTRGDGRLCTTFAKLNPSHALEVLASPRVLHLENPLLSDVLKTLNEHNVTLPSATVRTILDRAKSEPEYPWTYVRAEALVALARVSPAEARSEIDEALTTDDARVRTGAVDALRALLDLPDPYDLFPEDEPFESLPRPVQHVVAAVEFQGEVNNGGVSQYFFNSAGDHWPVALEGFKEMGAAYCVEMLETSTRFLGATGASMSRDKRIKAYARLSDEREKLLDDLSSRFYDDPDRFDELVVMYMARHAEIMKAAARHTKAE